MRKIIAGRRAGTGEEFGFNINTGIPGESGIGFFRIPISSQTSTGMTAVLVDWGDGSAMTYINSANYATATLHDYGASGIYSVKIFGGINSFSFRWMVPVNSGINDQDKLVEIVKWGSMRIRDEGAFEGCSNLEKVLCTDLPNFIPAFSSGESGTRLFQDCSSLVLINRISDWDTSKVLKMNSMFRGCTKLEGGNLIGGGINIGAWDVSNVTTMEVMFASATLFNGKMFNVGSTTTNLTAMFSLAITFNNSGTFSIESWDTSNVITMNSMFQGAIAFNRNISTWNTSSVEKMELMFANYNNNLMIFNQPIGAWNTAAVKNMNGIFYRNDVFDQDISNWNVDNWDTANNNFGISNLSSYPGGAADLNLSQANYDALLIAWDNYAFSSWPGGNVDFGESKYTAGGTAAAARAALVTKWGSITDGGPI